MAKGERRQKNTLILPRGPWLGLSSAANYCLSPGNVKSPWIWEHSLQHPHQWGQGNDPCGAQLHHPVSPLQVREGHQTQLNLHWGYLCWTEVSEGERLCWTRLSQLSFAHHLSYSGRRWRKHPVEAEKQILNCFSGTRPLPAHPMVLEQGLL